MASLGRSGVEVSRIILGCGNFGGIGSAPELFGQGESRDEAFAVMDAARELGFTTFDTADAYGGGRSETFIGDWLRERRVPRDEIVLSSKVFNPMDEGLDAGLAAGRVRRQLESSLSRLGVGHLDVVVWVDAAFRHWVVESLRWAPPPERLDHNDEDESEWEGVIVTAEDRDRMWAHSGQTETACHSFEGTPRESAARGRHPN